MKYLKLLKYKKFLINFYSILVKSSINIRSYLGLYSFFLSSEIRIKLINFEKFSHFSNNFLVNSKLASSKKNLAFKLLKKSFNPSLNIEYLKKFMFLIAPIIGKEDLINKLILELKNSNVDFERTQNLCPILISPLTFYGDHKNADRMRLVVKEFKDQYYKRKPGLYDESSYLTSLGHMCLFGYLLKAIEMGYLNTTVSNLSFVYNKKNVTNFLFFELILQKSKEFNLKVVQTNKRYNWNSSDEHEIEVIPSRDNSSYILARSIYGNIEKDWCDSGSKDFLNIPENYLDIGEKILSQVIDLKEKWIVGMHLRRTSDKRVNRNSSIKNAKIICESIHSKGGQVILVGTPQIKSLEGLGNVFNTSHLDLDRFERECMQLYVWSKSSFFVGSISGGTHPPGLFNVPTIWLDVHPTSHIRFPSPIDLVLPCKVFSYTDGRDLKFDEANSNAHCHCQSEMPDVTNRYGYKISPADMKSVNKALEIMYYKIGILKHDKDNLEINNKDFNSSLLGARYIFT